MPCHTYLPSVLLPLVLWRCWFGGRKGTRPVKNWVVGCWRGYLSGASCWLPCGPADATATHCLLLQWYPDCFYLSGTGYPGNPGKRAINARARVFNEIFGCSSETMHITIRTTSHSISHHCRRGGRENYVAWGRNSPPKKPACSAV